MLKWWSSGSEFLLSPVTGSKATFNRAHKQKLIAWYFDMGHWFEKTFFDGSCFDLTTGIRFDFALIGIPTRLSHHYWVKTSFDELQTSTFTHNIFELGQSFYMRHLIWKRLCWLIVLRVDIRDPYWRKPKIFFWSKFLLPPLSGSKRLLHTTALRTAFAN